MSALLPKLILDEIAARCGTLATPEDSPWHGATLEIVRPKPREEFQTAHGQIRIVVDPVPSPLEGRVDQNQHMHWTMDVTITGIIDQPEAATSEIEDDRLSLDDLGMAGVDAILTAISADEVFDGQGYDQLCDTVAVVKTMYGQTEDASAFGAGVHFRFTFQTRSRSWREHNYPESA